MSGNGESGVGGGGGVGGGRGGGGGSEEAHERESEFELQNFVFQKGVEVLIYVHRNRRLTRDGGAQDGHLDFHTAPEL